VACQAPDDPAPTRRDEPVDYVALGDSFTAAPGVPTTDGSDGCLRSSGNYPHLLATELPEVRLTDVSCGGADTTSMTQPHKTFSGATRPPQFDALSADTDLVSLGIGGNDFGVFGSISLGCIQLAATDPEGAPCREAHRTASGNRFLRLAPRIRNNVADVIAGIRERAPDARVIVVGYPRLLPASGSCPDRLALAEGDVGYVADVNRVLSDAVLAAADQEGVESIDLYTASRGHDVCSDEPWVNGYPPAPGAALLHPFAAEQQAVADLVLDTL